MGRGMASFVAALVCGHKSGRINFIVLRKTAGFVGYRFLTHIAPGRAGSLLFAWLIFEGQE